MTPETLRPADLIAPQPPVVDAETPEPTPPPPESETAAPPAEPTPEPERDAAGVAFDPERHVAAKHPKTGRWMPRRRSVADVAQAGPSFVAPDESPAPTAAPAGSSEATAPGPDVCDAMADLHCKAFYGIAVAFLSDEWLPSKGEHAANKSTLAAYYRAKGITPDKPGMALLAQFAAFAGPRLQMPKTQTRLGALRAWAVGKWMAWRGARRSANLQAATQ